MMFITTNRCVKWLEALTAVCLLFLSAHIMRYPLTCCVHLTSKSQYWFFLSPLSTGFYLPLRLLTLLGIGRIESKSDYKIEDRGESKEGIDRFHFKRTGKKQVNGSSWRAVLFVHDGKSPGRRSGRGRGKFSGQVRPGALGNDVS